jgi:transposase
MQEHTSVTAGQTVGLDLGDRFSQVCVLDEQGEVIEQARMRTTSAALQQRFARLPPMRVALEVGTHSPWVSRLVAGCGHEVIVASGQGIPVIKRCRRKTDQTDAEALARLARSDPRLLLPIQHRSVTAQEHLAVIRSRAALVRARARLVNHVRGSAKAVGVVIRQASTASFPRQALPQLPEALRPALVPVLASLQLLNEQIRELDRQVEHLLESRYPQARRLQAVQGVGPITALTYVLTLEDPRRFKSRCVGAYLGLVPRKRQSGAHDPELHISKTGNAVLRSLLVQCAHYILGHFGNDCDLRRWGLALAARGGKTAKRRAVVAVARRLAVLLHALWISDAAYEPLRHANAQAA